MKDIVLIPTWYRPEYLQLCLEHLAQTRGIESKQIWILQDQHQDDLIRHAVEENWTQDVLASWQQYKALDIRFIRATPHCTVGNSRNVLFGYHRAYNTGAKYVYLIEDDVFVTPDFFEWHEAVQNDGDYFCSVGYNCKYKRPDILTSEDPGAYYSARWYGSYGVGWKREKLAPIFQHDILNYVCNMTAYIERVLPNTPLGVQFTEQDGLIERIMWLSGKPVAFPYQSRAYHMGFYGYHREGARPNGFLDAKIAGLRKMVSDPATFTSSINNPFNDLTPFPTEFPGRIEKLQKLQEFV